MLSRLREPWTLGGRRISVTQSRSATAIPRRAESGRGERWTFGGRRDAQPSSREEKELKSSNFVKPCDGLEPSTPPYHSSWQSVATHGNGFGLFLRSCARAICR